MDVVADPSRDRFFVLRQDRNEVLVFDAHYLHSDSDTADVESADIDGDHLRSQIPARRQQSIGTHAVCIDLETLELDRIVLTKDYVQSIATSANAILISTRRASGGDNKIHRVDLSARMTTPLPTLGVFENKVALDTAIVGSANGRYILIAQPDGTLTFYDPSPTHSRYREKNRPRWSAPMRHPISTSSPSAMPPE